MKNHRAEAQFTNKTNTTNKMKNRLNNKAALVTGGNSGITTKRPMKNFDIYAFSKQPDYHEPTVRKEFAKAVPLRTVVIYCYDPRAAGIPVAVAREFGEV